MVDFLQKSSLSYHNTINKFFGIKPLYYDQ